MEGYYYISIEKDETGFFQDGLPDFDNLESYNYANYSKIIESNFTKSNQVVRLTTGKYKTEIFSHNDPSFGIYFCLVNKKNVPPKGKEYKITEEQKQKIRIYISRNINLSEGVFPENKIEIASQFITPNFRNHKSRLQFTYHSKMFEKDTIVLGAPGSGKTTLLRWTALNHLRDFLEEDSNLKKLPIYIQLRKFNSFNDNLETFINNSIINSSLNLKYLSGENFINSGKLTLILDGADEIDYNKFQNFCFSINSYKKKFPLISFIISSRPDRSFDTLNSFNIFEILPFNDSQIRELTFKKMSESKKWQDYISVLNSVPKIKEILRNPLLLSISHFLFDKKSILPLNTGQILKELVSVLITTWDSQRRIERRFNNESVNPNEITRNLGKLALILTENKSETVKYKEIINDFSNFTSLNDLADYFRYIEFATSLIKNESDVVRFSHKSLQDYFCSNYLVESLQTLNEKVFIDKDWNEILKMISGLSSDPNYLIKSMISNDKIETIQKVDNTFSILSETNSLTKEDLKESYDLLEKFIIEFEKKNKISNESVKVDSKEILINLIETQAGLKELIQLFRTIFKIRFTKYEYDFYGYFKNSNSTIMKSISEFSNLKGSINFELENNVLKIKNEEIEKGKGTGY